MAPVVSRIDDDHARLARNIRFLSFAAAANMFAWLAMKPARPEMILRITGGDDKRSAKLLALLTTIASLIEFLVTPLLGRLSDMYGRRPFLVGAPLLCGLARFNLFRVAMAELPSVPDVLYANWLDRCVGSSLFPMFMSVLRASLADMVLGEGLAKAMAGLMATVGLSVSIAPWLGSLIIHRTNQPKHDALAAACTSACTCLFTWA